MIGKDTSTGSSKEDDDEEMFGDLGDLEDLGDDEDEEEREREKMERETKRRKIMLEWLQREADGATVGNAPWSP